MSGGFIKPQDAKAHQVVIFTFSGALPADKVDAWNSAIKELKDSFGSSITGVTMTGDPSPAPAALTQARARVAARAARGAAPRRGASSRKAVKRRRK